MKIGNNKKKIKINLTAAGSRFVTGGKRKARQSGVGSCDVTGEKEKKAVVCYTPFLLFHWKKWRAVMKECRSKSIVTISWKCFNNWDDNLWLQHQQFFSVCGFFSMVGLPHKQRRATKTCTLSMSHQGPEQQSIVACVLERDGGSAGHRDGHVRERTFFFSSFFVDGEFRQGLYTVDSEIRFYSYNNNRSS